MGRCDVNDRGDGLSILARALASLTDDELVIARQRIDFVSKLVNQELRLRELESVALNPDVRRRELADLFAVQAHRSGA